MARNIVIDLGLVCPSCREYDVCGDDCICPSCWYPTRFDPKQRDDAVNAWRFFAPVTAAMNEENINWGWATEEKYQNRLEFSLEIITKDERWYEVVKHDGKYLVTHWRMKPGSRERDEPPEPILLDEVIADTPDEVVNRLADR